MLGTYNKISVGIINLGFNNIFSILNSLKNIGYKVKLIELSQKKIEADILLLPGVGSFPRAMNFLKKYHLNDKINTFNERKKLIFGICLGMQLLFDNSEEFGYTKGLGLISGNVKELDKNLIKKPNIGWFPTNIKRNFLMKFNFSKEMFYFVHSLYCKPVDKNNIVATTVINKFSFCSIVKYKNILGCQFHPEKSGEKGIMFLKSLKKFI
jgi:glutamine amidotransferase